jgi:acyl carrier protein
MQEIRQVILETVEDVARIQKKKLADLRDDLALLDSGLDSLCIAIIVARLDDELGLDPLSTAADDRFPVTVGEFISMYQDAAA